MPRGSLLPCVYTASQRQHGEASSDFSLPIHFSSPFPAMTIACFMTVAADSSPALLERERETSIGMSVFGEEAKLLLAETS